MYKTWRLAIMKIMQEGKQFICLWQTPKKLQNLYRLCETIIIENGYCYLLFSLDYVNSLRQSKGKVLLPTTNF